MRSMNSSCDVIHDASNLLDVSPACVDRCGTIRRALCANKRPNCSRHVAQKAQCARPRCAKRQAGVLATAGCPHLANVAPRAGERSARRCGKSALCGLPRRANIISRFQIARRPMKRRNQGWAQICVIKSWRYVSPSECPGVPCRNRVCRPPSADLFLA